MNLRKVDLNLLTVFDAVMREGNFTRAADKIGMTQPAVSEAVARLRHLFKDDLFIRNGRGVQPTPRAHQYAAPIRRSLDLIAATLSESHTFDFVTSTRAFNLFLGDYGELVILPSLMQWLDGMQAKVRINLRAASSDQVADQLRDGRLDLWLTSEPIVDNSFVNQPVGTERLVSMVRRDHPLVKDSLSLAQFLTLRHVMIEWHDPKGTVVEHALRARGIERQYGMQMHRFFDMPRVVSATDMICTLPSQMARHFTEAHNLKAYPLPELDIDIPMFLTWHKRFDPDPGHTWIRDSIIRLLTSR